MRNILVTAPLLENLRMLFELVTKARAWPLRPSRLVCVNDIDALYVCRPEELSVSYSAIDIRMRAVRWVSALWKGKQADTPESRTHTSTDRRAGVGGRAYKQAARLALAVQGLDLLEYAEHTDYDLVESTNPAFNKALVRINVFRSHRQACHVPRFLRPFLTRLLKPACGAMQSICVQVLTL